MSIIASHVVEDMTNRARCKHVPRKVSTPATVGSTAANSAAKRHSRKGSSSSQHQNEGIREKQTPSCHRNQVIPWYEDAGPTNNGCPTCPNTHTQALRQAKHITLTFLPPCMVVKPRPSIHPPMIVNVTIVRLPRVLVSPTPRFSCFPIQVLSVAETPAPLKPGSVNVSSCALPTSTAES